MAPRILQKQACDPVIQCLQEHATTLQISASAPPRREGQIADLQKVQMAATPLCHHECHALPPLLLATHAPMRCSQASACAAGQTTAAHWMSRQARAQTAAPRRCWLRFRSRGPGAPWRACALSGSAPRGAWVDLAPPWEAQARARHHACPYVNSAAVLRWKAVGRAWLAQRGAAVSCGAWQGTHAPRQRFACRSSQRPVLLPVCSTV